MNEKQKKYIELEIEAFKIYEKLSLKEFQECLKTIEQEKAKLPKKKDEWRGPSLC